MKPEREYILFCDESDRAGRHYSNFYGGLVVGASQYMRVSERLEQKKRELNLYGEVKWEKISQHYEGKYIELMKAFFAEVADRHVRVRVMFSHNRRKASKLSLEHQENEFFILYYQFLKHGFGVAHLPRSDAPVRLRLYFDQFPHSGEKVTQFKGYLLGLPKLRSVHAAGITLLEEDITEVRSHDHVLLQCLDVVLGAMTFRLNHKHRLKDPLTGKRGRRTRAKERVYKTILSEIHKIRPGLNIGISTGTGGDLTRRWSDAYLHWAFVPKEQFR